MTACNGMYTAGNKKGLSSLWLSLAAAVSMTLDHIAVILLDDSVLYLPFRSAGRIAFVIFAFLISQSIDKTASIKRFCMRLAIFAVITEPIFDISFYGTPFYPEYQNIFFTLLTGVAAIHCFRKNEKIGALLLCIFTVAAQLLGFDYGGIGVLLIFAFWYFGIKNACFVAAAFAVITALNDGMPNLFALASLPLILLYDGRRGGEKYPVLRRWFFYVYYPLHIFIIGALRFLKQQL